MRLLGLICAAGLLGLGIATTILALAPAAAPPTRLASLSPAPGHPPRPTIPAPRPRPAAQFGRSLRVLWRKVCRRFPGPDDSELIVVDVHTERLYLLQDGRIAGDWRVSTALRGIDQRAHSDGTPVGVFRVARKIGAGLPPDEVLQDQAPTGRIITPTRLPDDPAASRWITTRILWLAGIQPGWNEDGDFDTFLRHIYIHGTPNLGMLGQPASHGCVQMAPRAVMALYRAVPVGTPVLITPGTGRLSAIPGPAVS